MTIKEAARYLRLSCITVYKLEEYGNQEFKRGENKDGFFSPAVYEQKYSAGVLAA